MTYPLRVGLKLAGQSTTINALRGVWRLADEAGFDHVWDFDHLASIGPSGPDHPVFEGWALQAAMGVATQRVRIGCNVTGNAYRHPAQLAKLAVTVDHLSGGRLEFGIGAGWAQIEFQMLGMTGLENRVGRLDESLRVIKSLFTDDRTSFEGKYYHLSDAIANPKPLQHPHPPIWIGAGGDLMLKVVARHADVWNPTGPARGADYQTASEKLMQACAAIGRDESTIRRCNLLRWSGSSRQELLELVGADLERGFSEEIIYLEGNQAEQTAARAGEVLGDLRRLAG
ncbi:MAG: LLM class flavin-dependent oxidoreductase [Candidatus Dormibacteraceae bacterium]